MTYQELKDEEQLYLMHIHMAAFRLRSTMGREPLWDIDGKKYIDLTSGIGVSSLSHDNEALVSALNEQAHKLLRIQSVSDGADGAGGKRAVTSCGTGKIFFSNSGAEANEG